MKPHNYFLAVILIGSVFAIIGQTTGLKFFTIAGLFVFFVGIAVFIGVALYQLIKKIGE